MVDNCDKFYLTKCICNKHRFESRLGVNKQLARQGERGGGGVATSKERGDHAAEKEQHYLTLCPHTLFSKPSECSQ